MRSSALLLLALSACSAAPVAPPPPPPPAASTPASASPSAAPSPTPFTAAELRKATRPGRRYKFLREAAGKPKVYRTLLFVEVSDTQTTVESENLDDKGRSMGAPERESAAWEELRKHAEFPRDRVVITEEKVTVPAGTFDCLVYTVTEGKGDEAVVSRFYFAKELPGPPILWLTEKGGARMATSTLIEHQAGK